MIKFRLHLKMAEQKMQLKDLHEATGIRSATLSNYYHDKEKSIKPEHLDKLCKYFNCKLSDIIEYVEDEE